MATVNLLFEKTLAKIDTITLDASLSETHTADVEVTSHPVEQGAAITDHMRAKPRTITIEGIVTNTAMPDPGADASKATTTEIRTPDGKVAYQSRTPTVDQTRAGAAYRDLLALRAGKLVTVVTGIETFENMAITSINVPRDAKTGQALKFSITLQEITQVSSATTKIVEDKVKSKKDLGKKTGTPTPDATKNKSILKSVKDSNVIQNGVKKIGSILGNLMP